MPSDARRRSPRCRGSGCGPSAGADRRRRPRRGGAARCVPPGRAGRSGGCARPTIVGAPVTAVTVRVVEFTARAVRADPAMPCAAPSRGRLGGPPGAGAAGAGRAGPRRRRPSRWRRTRRPSRRPRRAPPSGPSSVAEAVADSPTVAERRRHAGPVGDAAAVRRDRSAATPASTSWSSWRPTGSAARHPDPAADRQAVRRHHRRRRRPASVFTQEYTGTLGPSMRAVVPVARRRQRVVGAGLGRHHRLSGSTQQLRGDLGPIAGWRRWPCWRSGWPAPGWSAAGCAARRTGSASARSPGCTSTTSAVLHAVREGLLLLDDDRPGAAGQRRGPAAARACPTTSSGRRSTTSACPPGLVAAAAGPRPRERRDLPRRRPVLVVNSAPASWQGRDVGRPVVTLRDHTELRLGHRRARHACAGSTESLRSQNHEAANRLHTVVSLIEMGRAEEAVDFATEELAGRPAAHRPGRRRGRASRCSRRCCSARPPRPPSAASSCTIDRTTIPTAADVPSRELVTMLGNLVDNAIDAVTGASDAPGRRSRSSTAGEAAAACVVGDSGPGLDPRAGAARVSSAAGRPRRAHGAAAAGSGWPWSARSVRRHGGRDPDRHRRPAAAPSSTVDVASRPRGRGRHAVTVRVLVVEDEAARRRGPRDVRRAGARLRGRRGGPLGGRRGAAPQRRPPRRPDPARHAPARRPRPRAAPAAARRRAPVRRDRGDLGPRRRRGAARRRAGGGAVPAQAVHVRRRSGPSSSSTPPTAPSSRRRRRTSCRTRSTRCSARCARPRPAARCRRG